MSSSFHQIFGYAGGDDGDDEDVDREPPRIPWFGPPEDELGVAVQLGAIVARSENGVVALSHATVYSTGVGFDVIALARGLKRAETNRLMHEQHLFELGEEPSAGLLRIGLELPGGERVSNLGGRMGRRRFMKPEEQPEGPIFFEHGGGGGSAGSGRVSMRPGFWLWPLPEPETIRLSCEWPIVEIPLSTVEIDGAALRAAAAGVLPLWQTSA